MQTLNFKPFVVGGGVKVLELLFPNRCREDYKLETLVKITGEVLVDGIARDFGTGIEK